MRTELIKLMQGPPPTLEDKKYSKATLEKAFYIALKIETCLLQKYQFHKDKLKQKFRLILTQLSKQNAHLKLELLHARLSPSALVDKEADDYLTEEALLHKKQED
jgi:hypothetical protein